MRRTAADFSKDARKDDPYEYVLKNRKTPILPKAFKHFTHAEKQRALRAEVTWNKAILAEDVEAILSIKPMDQPMMVGLQIRFGKDFDAFWVEAAEWPEERVTDLVAEIDKHYSDDPTDDKDEDPESEAGKARLSSVGS